MGYIFLKFVAQFLICVFLESFLALTVMPNKVNHAGIIPTLLNLELFIEKECIQFQFANLMILKKLLIVGIYCSAYICYCFS